jgi:hypothetical protein
MDPALDHEVGSAQTKFRQAQRFACLDRDDSEVAVPCGTRPVPVSNTSLRALVRNVWGGGGRQSDSSNAFSVPPFVPTSWRRGEL